MRNVTIPVSMSLVLVFLLLTALSSTAQAGRDGGFWNLERFRGSRDRTSAGSYPFHPLDRHGNHSISTTTTTSSSRSSEYCSANAIAAVDVRSLSSHLLHYRGGDDVVDQVGDETSTITEPTNRIDVATKAKTLGKFEFSLFQKGDGSDDDPDGVPVRYLNMQLLRRDLAIQATRATLAWREEKSIDSILNRPRPDFDVAKAVFPHYFVQRDVNGHVVFVQRPALLNLKLAAKNGLDNKALLDHYVYVNEYLWQIVESENSMATMTGIIDMSGLNLGVIRKADIINFLKEFIKTMDSHYPQRAHKTLIVNAPKWFNVLYKIISPLLRESTKSRIEIHARGKRQDKALVGFLGNDAKALLPESFFSKTKESRNSKVKTDDEDDGEEGSDPQLVQDSHVVSQLESDLRLFTLARLNEAGLKMQQVEPV